MTDPECPPVAPPRPQHRSVHGVRLDDPYAWLRDANWREAMREPDQLDSDIRAYLEAENAHTDAQMAASRPLQAELLAEMRGRILEKDASVPSPHGPWQYYARFRKGGEHAVYCRRPRDGGDEQILLDAEAQARGRAYYRLAAVAHSNDHRLLAWSLDESGAEVFTLQVCDIASGEAVGPPVPETAGQVVWSADSSTLFFTTLDENHRPCRVWRLAVGAEPDTAELVYEEPDPGFFVGVGETQSERFIVIDAHDHETSEVRLIDSAQPWSAPRVIAPRDPGVEYSLEDDGNTLVILTNADGAEDFKLVTAPLDDPGRANWRDLVAHEPGRLILGHTVLARHHLRMERVDALPRIVITAKADNETHAIEFAEQAYALGMDPGMEYDTDTIRFVYSSPTRPDEVY
ncbi:MAG: S9 family peptidase, partial [Salinisphaera sp.]|nr:S9 family peptidase [Salinisphaera sp.]